VAGPEKSFDNSFCYLFPLGATTILSNTMWKLL